MPSINKKKVIIISLLVWVAWVVWAQVVHEYQIMHDVPQKAPTVSDLTVANLLKDVNAQRTKVGVAPLKEDPLLDKSAQLKADEIHSTGVYSHTDATGKHGYDYIKEVGVRGCTYVSENLAGPRNAHEAVTDWLGSKPHREAMLAQRYDTTGFGISSGPGYSYVVEHFCDLP